jgi:hypothetical protein
LKTACWQVSVRTAERRAYEEEQGELLQLLLLLPMGGRSRRSFDEGS